MKVLVSFQPNKKASDFEGVRLRKTIKGALEMVGVDYTTSIVERHDVVHLISPEDENKLNDAKENDIPVVVSALYCENDPLASYLEHKTKDNERLTELTTKAQRFLNKADLVLVPSETAREFLVDKGITADVSVAMPGINMSRFDFSRDDEKAIFYRYFREDPKRKLILGIGEYDGTMEGISSFVGAAKAIPDALFYYIGRETIPGIYNSLKMKRLFMSAPKNLKFINVVPDDIYRSAMLNATLFVIPGYRTTGVMSLMDAMAAKCQIIARKQAVFPDILVDGKTAYLGQFSETITSLIKDYLEGKLKPTTEEAYKYVSKYNLRATGEQLRWFYLEQINIKKLSK